MPKETGGRFIQVLESDNGQIFRLVLSSREKPDLSNLCVVGDSGELINADPVLLYEDRRNGRFATYVSLELDGSLEQFSVVYQGVLLAKMTPLRKKLMIQQRDMRMCNPAVDGGYGEWLKRSAPKSEGVDDLSFKPLLSIVTPLYNTPSVYLREMLDSVLAQTYGEWELVLVNASSENVEMQDVLAEFCDDRIRVLNLTENLGIAGNTNEGIRAAKGDYVGFLDHDDTLDPCALEKYARAINENREIDLLYCDEDNFQTVDQGYYAPLFKPDFNLDLLYSHNYVVHFLMVSRFVLDKVELSPDDVSGAQDYDLTLKAWEHARSIQHVPEVLYHWRAHEGSTNGGQMESKPYAIAAGAKALSDHFERRGLRAEVSPSRIPCVYEVAFTETAPVKLAAIVFRRGQDSLRSCLDSMLLGGSCVDCCVVVGPCGDDERAVLESRYSCSLLFVSDIPGVDDGGLPGVLRWFAPDDLALVCSSSVVFEDGGSLALMKGLLSRSEVAIAAPKILFPDGLVQHAGLCFREDGSIGFLNQDFTNNMGGGYLGLAECLCDYGAVSPMCFMTRARDLEGFCAWPVSPSSVEEMASFCCKKRAGGRLVVVQPEVLARSVGIPLGLGRFGGGRRLSCGRDVLFNPNVDLMSSYPRLNISRHPVLSAIKSVLKHLLKVN